MPTLSSLALPPPRNWQDFEDICCDLWHRLWRDPGTQKNGRSGQPQAGVDVFGRPDQGTLWAGVQCKVREEGSRLSREEIEEEVRKAKTFRPPLSRLIIATTTQRDANAQRIARELTERQIGEGFFPVSIASWDDILLDLAEHPDLIAKHYPDLFAAVKQVGFPASDIAAWWLRPSGPFQVPALPTHFVQRPEITRTLKSRLLAAGDAVPGVLAISAIHGLGGVGKSTLVAALLQDPDVNRRFSGGILWATLGQEPNLLEFLRAWIQSLGDYEFQALSPAAASSHLATLLAQRSVLMIVDDVWKGGHALPFRVGGPQCRLVVTTRRADVAEELGAELHEIDVMTPDEALSLLESRLGRSITLIERGEALQLAKEVGYLPLALELSAARVARGISWETLTRALTEEIARLEELESPRRRRSRGANRLEVSLGLSLDSLRGEDPKAWEAFVWLGILKEDAFITETSVATLWSCDRHEASEILEVLRNDALLQQSLPIRVGESLERAYRLHDILGDIARRTLTALPPRGLGIELAAAHGILLNRYRKHLGGEHWHLLTDDGYICAHLTWHMEKAGKVDLVHGLFQESTGDHRNGWYQACERLGRTTVFVADLFRAWRLAEEGQGVNTGSDTIALQYRYALIASTLNSLTQNLPPNLLRLLVRENIWSPMQALIYVKRIPDNHHQASILIELALLLSQTPFVAPMLEIVHGMSDLAQKARVLAALAPFESSALDEFRHLVVKSWRDASVFSEFAAFIDEPTARAVLLSILDCDESLNRDRMLADFAGALPQALSGFALEVIGEIRRGRIRAEAFRLVVRGLPDSDCEKALDLAWQIVLSSDRLEALLALIPRLSEIPLKKALSQIMVTGNTSDFLAVLEVSVSKLPDEMIANALEVVKNLHHLPDRARGLASLAPRCGVLWEQLENATQGMESSLRLRVLARLAEHLPESLVIEATIRVNEVNPELARAEVIGQLAPRMTPSTRRLILVAAQQIRTERLRVSALLSCAPYLDEFLLNDLLESTEALSNAARVEILTGLARRVADALPRCLEFVGRIEADWWRSRALANLAPHLTEDLFPELLRLMAGLRGDEDRARCLVQIGPHLPDSELAAFLRLAEVIRLPAWRASALLSLEERLLPSLREATQQQILSAAGAIDDPSPRREILSRLAAQVTPDLLPALVSEAQAIRDGREQMDVVLRFSPAALESALRLLDLRGGLGEGALALIIGTLGRRSDTSTVEAYLGRVLAIEDDALRVETLCSIAPSLSKGSLWEAMAFLKGRGEFEEGSEFLRAFLPVLPGSGSTRGHRFSSEETRDLPWPDWGNHGPLSEGLVTANALRETSMQSWLNGSLEESRDEDAGSPWPDEVVAVDRSGLVSRDRIYEKAIAELSNVLVSTAARLAGDQRTTSLQEALELATSIVEELEGEIDLWDKLARPGLLSIVTSGSLQPQAENTDEVESLRAALTSLAARFEAERGQVVKTHRSYISKASLREALKVAEQIVEDLLRGVEGPNPLRIKTFEVEDENELHALRFAVVAAAVRTRGNRGHALAALAPYLTKGLSSEALGLAMHTVEEKQRAEALSGLIPYLPAELLEQALSAAIGIADDELRSAVIAASSSHLPLHLVARAFDSVAKSRDLSARVKGILALVPQLPPDLKRRAFLAILAIPQEVFRARGIVGFALSAPVEMCNWICPEASAFIEPGPQALALLGLGCGDDLDPMEFRKLLGETLHGIASLSRKEAFRHLSVLHPVLEANLETRICGEILRAVIDVGTWWP